MMMMLLLQFDDFSVLFQSHPEVDAMGDDGKTSSSCVEVVRLMWKRQMQTMYCVDPLIKRGSEIEDQMRPTESASSSDVVPVASYSLLSSW